MAGKRKKQQKIQGQANKGTKRFGRKMIKRLLMVTVFMLVFFGIVIVNLISYQLRDSSQYQKKVLSQQNYSSTTLYYRRGDILDRKGSYLATSTKIYNLILEPKNINKSEDYVDSNKVTYKEITINALYKYFDFKQGEVEQLLEEHPDSYYYVAFKELTYSQVADFMDYLKSKEGAKIIGVSLEENYSRTYPNKTAACQLIGYTSSGNVGNWGLEQQYNDTLNGINGRSYSYMNNDGTMETEVRNATDGNTIVSTIDLNVQNIVDKQVSSFMKKIGAKNASVLVMNPNNAEILAMSNSKVYDLNAPYDETALEQIYTAEEIAAMSEEDKVNGLNEIWRNFIISDTYEPGSTFKPFTVCAALEESSIHDGDNYYCGGYLHVGDYDIKCHNTAGDGWLDVEKSIATSCNVALMQIGDLLGKDKFLKYQSLFGFGQYTNIDLPGEATAETLIFNEDTLGVTELATSTFGQGLNCTMIQLATGFSSLINGGNYYEPHVVKEIRNADGGTVETKEKKLVKKTVSKSTSKLIKRYLKTTVEEGTGTGCQIAGYEIGGKTGTAEKGTRGNGKYLISFIGFAPYDNPEVVVYVTIDEINLKPQDQTSYAVKLARQIFKQILPYMGVEQEEVSEEEAEKEIINVNEDGTVSTEDNGEDSFDTTEDGQTTQEDTTQEDTTQESTSQDDTTQENTSQAATTQTQ